MRFCRWEHWTSFRRLPLPLDIFTLLNPLCVLSLALAPSLILLLIIFLPIPVVAGRSPWNCLLCFFSVFSLFVVVIVTFCSTTIRVMYSHVLCAFFTLLTADDCIINRFCSYIKQFNILRDVRQFCVWLPWARALGMRWTVNILCKCETGERVNRQQATDTIPSTAKIDCNNSVIVMIMIFYIL